jgi:hypothetical protein
VQITTKMTPRSGILCHEAKARNPLLPVSIVGPNFQHAKHGGKGIDIRNHPSIRPLTTPGQRIIKGTRMDSRTCSGAWAGLSPATHQPLPLV